MSDGGSEAAEAPRQDPMLARARDLVRAALFIALGITVPMLFHIVGLGRVFLPMHLPILIGALLLRPGPALLVGLITPWASMLFTGMPPLPMAVVMSAELAALAGAASGVRAARAPAWLAVVVGIAVRVGITWLVTTSIGGLLGLPAQGVGWASVVAGAPGIALQLVVAPASALVLVRRRSS